MLRDPKCAGCCEPPTVVHRTYHLLQDILVQYFSDDHLDNLVQLLLVSAYVSDYVIWNVSQIIPKLQNFKLVINHI